MLAETLEELTAQLNEAFGGEFMTPDIELEDFYSYESTDGGTNFVQAQFFDIDDVAFDEFREADLRYHKQWFGARISAAGYLDATPWVAFKTEREAMRYLLDTYAKD